MCENPKHSLKLLNNLGIKKKLISLHDHNEQLVINKISNDLTNKEIALISDSGSPLISDPGYKLIKHCIENNIRVTSIPGPTSIIPALQLSGHSINEFCFLGFFPKTKNHMNDYIKEFNKINQTIVFFVSKHKIKICLEMLQVHLKDRNISVAKELTKINEYIFRGSSLKVSKEILQNKHNIKGEFVIVVEEKITKKSNNFELKDYDEQIRMLLSKFSLTDVVQIVHKLTGITKNKVYKWVLSLKKLQN